ncbi:MAG: histidine kinase [Nitriliruptorales bacterium]|nr:histidine kinase [Nitriliruptorales bacterium]
MITSTAAPISVEPPHRAPAWPWLPWLAWALAFAAVAGSTVDAADASAIGPPSDAALAVGVLSMATIGALVVARGNARLPGWLLLGSALLWSVYLYAYHLLELVRTGRLAWDLGTAQIIIAVGEEAAYLAIIGLLLLFVVIPDGSVPRGPGRAVAWLLGLTVVPWTIETIWLSMTVVDLDLWVARTTLTSLSGAEPGPILETGITILTVVTIPTLPLAAAALVRRYRSSDGEERQQLKWILFGGLAVLVWLGLWVPNPTGEMWSNIQSTVPGVAITIMAVAFGLALFRYRLWDVDLVVRRSLVYGVLWLLIAGAYAAVAAALGLAAGARFPVEAAVLLTIAATLVFQPARRQLEGLADRWVFGQRDTPAEAVRTLGTSAEQQSRPADIADELADVTMRALRPRAVRVEVSGIPPTTRGQRLEAQTAISLPIRWGREKLGTLECQPRVGEQVTEDDRALLEALVSQAALALSHARLLVRMVDAQDREARRIERDIHDGAQQDVAALMGQLGLARAQANGDPAMAATFDRLQGEARRILASIRELSQGIHPSVLRDRGLVAAIEDRRARLPVPLRVHASPALAARRFDPAVEAAAWFTISEALTNAVKHAESASVDVMIDADEDVLTIEVADDGIGFDVEEVGAGTGIAGMSDRIAAIGGTLDLDGQPGGGTRVKFEIPLDNPQVVS